MVEVTFVGDRRDGGDLEVGRWVVLDVVPLDQIAETLFDLFQWLFS